jgi:hypothetical protein
LRRYLTTAPPPLITTFREYALPTRSMVSLSAFRAQRWGK